MPGLYQASEELIGKAGWELTSERQGELPIKERERPAFSSFVKYK